MAFVPLVPVLMAISVTQGLAQEYQSPAVQNFSGAAIDLSAWTSLTAKLVPPSAVPYGADTTFGTVTANSSGIVTLVTSTSDLATLPPGSAKLVISGKPTSGDSAQVLATGTINLLNS